MAATTRKEQAAPDLQTLRERVPMTQQELATAAGISRMQVVRIEAGHVDRVRPSTARKIAKALRLPPRVVAAACRPPTANRKAG